MSEARVFAYCHDSVGIGHLVRTTAICERLSSEFPGTSFLVATGTPYIALFEHLPRVDFIKLPSLTKVNGKTYRSKYLPLPMDRMMRCREETLQTTIEHFDPTLVLIDKAPLGVCGELIPVLKWLRRHRPTTKVVFGMRDIEDAPEATIAQWQAMGVFEMLEACFDEIWVYGERDVFDVVAQYRLPPAVEGKLRYMGYVTRGRCDHEALPHNGTPSVLVTVGGGTDGEFLLKTFLDGAAQRAARMGWSTTMVGGPDLPRATAHQLREQASAIPSVAWSDFEPCLTCRVRTADLVVTMGGYNTLCQIAAVGKTALVVPRHTPRLEQTMRARLWSGRGIVHMADAAGLSPTALADQVVSLLEDHPRPIDGALDLQGLDRVTARVDALLFKERVGEATLPM